MPAQRPPTGRPSTGSHQASCTAAAAGAAEILLLPERLRGALQQLGRVATNEAALATGIDKHETSKDVPTPHDQPVTLEAGHDSRETERDGTQPTHGRTVPPGVRLPPHQVCSTTADQPARARVRHRREVKRPGDVGSRSVTCAPYGRGRAPSGRHRDPIVGRAAHRRHPPWHLPQRQGPHRRHQPVHRRMERPVRTVHLDQDRRPDPRPQQKSEDLIHETLTCGTTPLGAVPHGLTLGFPPDRGGVGYAARAVTVAAAS